MAKKKKSKKKGKIQNEILETANNIWLAGLGALSAVEREGEKAFQNLVERGQAMEAKGRKQAKRAGAVVEDAAEEVKSRSEGARQQAQGAVESLVSGVGGVLDDRVRAAMKRLNVPTRTEIRTLSDRVAELTSKVEELKNKPPKKATTARSGAASKTTRAVKTTKAGTPRKTTRTTKTTKTVKG